MFMYVIAWLVLNILVLSGTYIDNNRCGGETYLHHYLKEMVRRGHDVRVLVMPNFRDRGKNTGGVFDGVEVIPELLNRTFEKQMDSWCDCVVSHLSLLGNMMQFRTRPQIFISHNDIKYGAISRSDIRVVYNSNWTAKTMDYPNESVVCRPKTTFRTKRVSTQDKRRYVTLINFCKLKGGEVLQKLAWQMPDVEFLAVRGAYGKQVEPMPDNVTIMDNTLDIDSVYKMTKVLLMPSEQESWGRVAAEAAEYGIPIISTETRGVMECMEEAAIYCDHPNQWAFEVNALLTNSEYYQWASNVVRRRLDVLAIETQNDFDRFEYILQ